MKDSKYSRYTTPDTIKKLSTARILDLWETTSDAAATPELATVRGWLMDELEKRNPDGFNKWLDLDFPEDNELRQYMIG